MKFSFKTNRLFVFIAIALLLSAMAEFYFAYSSGTTPDIRVFAKQLDQKQQIAVSELKYLKAEIDKSSSQILQSYIPKDDAVVFYLFNQGDLRFWTSNFTNLDGISFNNELEWKFFQSSNAYNVACYIRTNEGNLVALIPIKSNYPIENSQLQNAFFPPFSLDKQIQIVHGKPTDRYAFTDASGAYLFSFEMNGVSGSNPLFLILGFAIQVCFLILLYVFVAAYLKQKNKISLRSFLVVALLTLLLSILSMYFSWPQLLYSGVLVSAFDYSAGYLMTSIVHLILLTIAFFALSYVFYKYVSIEHVNKVRSFVLLLLAPALVYVLVFFILKGLVLHSRLPVHMLSFDDIHVHAVLLHIIMLIWSASLGLLWVKVHAYAIANKGLRMTIQMDACIILAFIALMFVFNKPDLTRLILFQILLLFGIYLRFVFRNQLSIVAFVSIWLFLFTLFFVETTSMFTRKKNEQKYKILAENILLNGSNNTDKISDLLLTELDSEIKQDAYLMDLLLKTTNSDVLNVLSAYISDRYFRGYWNKFQIQIELLSDKDILLQQYKEMLKASGKQVAKSSFYGFDASLNNMAYMGIYQFTTTTGHKNLVLRFFPRKNFKSFSFPSFLFDSSSDIEVNLNIALAHFKGDELVYRGEYFNFPTQRSYYPSSTNKFLRYTKEHQRYYIYTSSDNEIVVIAELNNYKLINYALYFADLYIAYLFISFLIVWVFFRQQMQHFLHFGFRLRFQFAFVLLLVLSFFAILIVSVRFVSNKYKEEQLLAIDTKKSYIQHALQEKYYWIQDIETINYQGLNFDLQELSYKYQTEISVYNMDGKLAGSSQPLIFNKNLIGRYMAPASFFGQKMPVNIEEKIGNLSFLTGYTPLYNGDYLQIGYIAVPVFLSNQEYNREIRSFVNVISHIYLIIALLSVLLSFIIGKQISAPLTLIGTKLRQMSLSRKNERIDYQYHDEIGQLVNQYNNAILELEKSVDLLARSERELAWRTMARQIAHEINNPLTPMKLTLQQLQRTHALKDKSFEDYFQKSTQTLVEQIDNLARIAGSFSNFARLPEARLEPMDVATKLISAIQLFENNNGKAYITYEGARSGIFILSDQEQIKQVFNNLLKNALQAIPSESMGKIDVKLQTLQGKVSIKIADNGVGISNELLEKIFIPNFTTKSNGMGLGLAIAKSIVDTMGGTIEVESQVGKGSTFTLLFTAL